MMLNVLIGCFALLVLLLIFIRFKTPKFVTISRSQVIQASPETLFRYINGPRLIQEWNAFTFGDPTVKLEYSGPAEGVGAQWSWEGRKSGAGRATIITSEPAGRVSLRLDFIRPFTVTNDGEYVLARRGDATEVTWTIHESARIPRVLSCFINLDKMIGAQFEKGLTKLRELAEAKTSHPA